MHRFFVLAGLGTAVLAAACSTTPGTPLPAVASRNDADGVRRMLAVGHPADERDGRGMTALMSAARFDAVDAMTVLLDAGAGANTRDTNHRWTALFHAIHKQHPRALRLLLERGADPNLASAGGNTPLLMAAGDPNPAMATMLLEAGADPRVEGPSGATPLTQAVSGGALTDVTDRPLLGGCRPAIVRALLAHDPTLQIPDTSAGRAAVWWARFHNCSEVLQMVDAERRHQTATAAEMLIRTLRNTPLAF